MFRNDFFHLDFKNNVKIKNIYSYIFKILYQYSIIIILKGNILPKKKYYQKLLEYWLIILRYLSMSKFDEI